MSSASKYRYRVVDVFTQTPLEGNPLAVFPDGSGLDEATMPKIAKELNLSETVFVFPPTRADCAASLRIFTPAKELPFAGHPTVGTSFVLLAEGMVPKESERFMVEEKIGPVSIRVEQGDQPLIWLTTPPIQNGQTYDPALCAEVLGLRREDLLDPNPRLLTAGNPTLFVALRNRDAVDRAGLDTTGLKKLKNVHGEAMCVFIFTPTPEGAYSRMFAPDYGIPEDPATGSSTGPLAEYMIRNQLISTAAGTRFVSEQGTKMGRRSILHVHLRGTRGVEGIEVGGYTTPVIDAVMYL